MLKSRVWVAGIAAMAVIIFCGSLSAETVVRPDTTTGIIVAAGDSLFGLPKASARSFDLNDLPDIETTVASDTEVELGDAYKVDIYAYGASSANGVYFRTVTSSGSRTVYAQIYTGSADSVRVTAWLYD